VTAIRVGVRTVHGMAAIGCVRRVTCAATIGVANMEIVAAGMPIEMAEVKVALSSAQKGGDHQECAREDRAADKHEG
jgi:hypothetical protein